MHKLDIKSTLEDYPLHVMEARKLGNNIKIVSEVDRIVIAGMGHSAIVGDVIHGLMKKDPIPVQVVRDYTLPAYVDNKTLVFVLTYSGNTEETIAMYSDALKKKAKVIVISSGGKLGFLVHESKAKMIRIPSGLVGRHGFFLQLFPILNVLMNNKLTSINPYNADELATLLRNPLWQKKAEDVAGKLKGKIPLIYTTTKLEGVGKRWKAILNHNAKVHAFSNTFPDWSHAELQGFQHLNGNYHVILIEDEKDSIRDRKTLMACKALLKEQNIPLTELVVRGQFLVTKAVSAICLGDWVSYYLALKNNVDPGQLSLGDNFKKRL